MLVGLLIWAGIVIVSMVAVSWLAVRWGRDPFGWALLSAVLGPIAIVALVGTRQSDRERPAAFERATPVAPRPAGQSRVVAGIDGSEHSERAARYIAQAHPQSTEVVLLTVFPHEARPREDAASQDAHERDVARLTGAALNILRDAGLAARVAVGYGNPGEELIRCADEEDADLIVIGRRGAGLSRAVLGSVSDHVVKNARRNVAVVE